MNLRTEWRVLGYGNAIVAIRGKGRVDFWFDWNQFVANGGIFDVGVGGKELLTARSVRPGTLCVLGGDGAYRVCEFLGLFGSRAKFRVTGNWVAANDFEQWIDIPIQKV